MDILQLFNRPTADITNPTNVTSRPSLSFDVHERLYCTLGEVCKVMDVDDKIVESFTSSDGLPFVAIATPTETSDAQVRRRFVCATTKAIHIYKQHDPDEPPSLALKKIPLATINVVGAVPVSQRILSVTLFGPNQEHVALLTTQSKGCVVVYLDLMRQTNMHPGTPDHCWGTRAELGQPTILCGSSFEQEIIIVNPEKCQFVCYDVKGTMLSTWLEYGGKNKEIVVTAATVDDGNRLNVAFHEHGKDHVDIYGTSRKKHDRLIGKTSGNGNGSEGASKYQQLWRFQDDGLAPFGKIAALCVGGANNVVVLDDRINIPFPNCISWDEDMIESKLVSLQKEENNLNSVKISDEMYGFQPSNTVIVWPEDGRSGGTPYSMSTAAAAAASSSSTSLARSFIQPWREGLLRARSKTTNAIVVSVRAVRLRLTDGMTRVFTSPFSSLSDHDPLPLAVALSSRLCRDDGEATEWRTTSYVRRTEEMFSADALFDFSKCGDLVFDEDEVVSGVGYVVQVEVRGRSGMESGLLGGAVLPGTCVDVKFPTSDGYQQYDVETDPVMFQESLRVEPHVVTVLMEMYVEPSVLSIQNAAEIEEGEGYSSPSSPKIIGAKGASDAAAAVKEVEGEEKDGESDAGKTSRSSPVVERVDTPTILFGRRDIHNEEEKKDEEIKKITPSPSFSSKNIFLPPPTKQEHVSEEVATIRELLSRLTTSEIPQHTGLVWKVGSTGGDKLRAYMSLRTLATTTVKLQTLVGQEMAGLPLSMSLSDLGCSVKRIRCAAALLLLSLVAHDHRANQRMLRRCPGFTVKSTKKWNEEEEEGSTLHQRIFWAPSLLRSEYVAETTRRNQKIEANNAELQKTGGSGGPLKRRRVAERLSNTGFMSYLKRKLSAGMKLDYQTMTGLLREGDGMRVRRGTKSFDHTLPVKCACYPAAKVWKELTPHVAVGEDVGREHGNEKTTTESEERQEKEENEKNEKLVKKTIDHDKRVLDWCPDPAEHLLSFAIAPKQEHSFLPSSPTSSSSLSSSSSPRRRMAGVDLDTIDEMMQSTRLRETFDKLGKGAAIPLVRPSELSQEPVLRAILGEEAVDAMVGFFVHQRKKEFVTWSDVCEYRRFHKFSELASRQSEVEETFLSKIILLKKFRQKKVLKGPPSVLGVMSGQNHAPRTELLTNISIYADPSHSRLRIDLTLYPSDGSKYRAYVRVPTAGDEVVSPRVKSVKMLTMSKKVLLDLIGRLELPSGHVVWTGGSGKAGGKMSLAVTTNKDEDSFVLESSNKAAPPIPIKMCQIKYGGAPFRPHALLKKQATTRKVLRSSLVLGKSLWQQSRVDDAYSLMQLASIRALELIPVRSIRTEKEEDVKMELLQCAKRAKVYGRRDPGMAVMLLRSTFSKCLLRLMGKDMSISNEVEENNDSQEEEGEENMIRNKRRFERREKKKNRKKMIEKQRKEQSDALNAQMFRLNVDKIHAERQHRQAMLDAKEKKIDRMNERRALIKESERRTRQQERVDRFLETEKMKKKHDAAVEKDEDTWYTEGKKLEQMKIDMERKDREQKKKKMLEERALKKRVALEKRKNVEAARVAAIESRAAMRGGAKKASSFDFGFDDDRRQNS